MDVGTIDHRGERLLVDLDTGRGQFRVMYRGVRVSDISLDGLKGKLADMDRSEHDQWTMLRARLDEVAARLPEGARCTLRCGPAVVRALRIPDQWNSHDATVKPPLPKRFMSVIVDMSVGDDAFQVEYVGEPIGGGTLRELLTGKEG